MAEVAHQQPSTFSFHDGPRSTAETHLYSDEPTTGRQTPDWFSFPAKPSGPLQNAGLQIQASGSTEDSLRTHSKANNSMSALPAFSFNPGNSNVLSTQEAGNSSAVSAPTTPARAGRHRRTASELIGGNPRAGVPQHQSSSPMKAWNERPLVPSAHPFGSLPSRLEHRHRRTDTMSSQDMTNTYQTSQPPYSTSSMSSSDITLEANLELTSTSRMDGVPHPTASPLATPRFRHLAPGSDLPHAPKSPTRHRVGFSETLEFIPRPLSTISSESGSSMSTIRAHSMSGSISSVMCSGTSSPLSKAVCSPMNLNFDASAMLLKTSPANPVSEDASVNAGRNHAFAENSIVVGASPPYPQACQNTQENIKPVDCEGVNSAVELPKQRRPGAWSSLLGRKLKTDLGHPTPSIVSETLQAKDVSSHVQLCNENAVELSDDFDADPTSIIISEPHSFAFTPPITPPVTPNERRRFGGSPENATGSNMIDLDLASEAQLVADGRGPKGRSFSEARRSMHSNALTSGFMSSNVHHRADSAPSITSVGFDPTGFRDRSNSNSSFKRPQMEDVFEEEEDDSPPKGPYIETSMRSRYGLGLAIQDSTTMSTTDIVPFPTTPSDVAGTPTHLDFSSRKLRFDVPWDNISTTGSDSVDSGRDDGINPDATLGPRNSGSFIKTASEGSFGRHRRSAGSDTFPLPNRFNNTPLIRTGSPLFTSNCGCGNDCSNLRGKELTVTSATDIRKHYAQSVGERGSDLRCSVDDVPSLVSSGSTVISNAHARAPSSSRSFAPRSTSSSLSLSSGLEPRRKRSSIVSFSRLVGSPFADRPRTPLEPGRRWQTPVEVEDPKPQKPSRLSRLIKFWKPKDNTS